MSLLPSRLSEGLTADNKTSQAHLESAVKVRHLLGVIPLRDSDTLLHLLSLRLDFFPKCNKTVNSSLERADKWLWIKCCVKFYKNLKLEVGIGVSFHIRPGSALDCAMSFSEKAPTKSLTSNLP
jgi:hypothetical protein